MEVRYAFDKRSQRGYKKKKPFSLPVERGFFYDI
jgi:hypothetical protein